MSDDNLTIEEIQCLAWYGLDAMRIRKMRLDEFDKLYYANQEQFEQWLKKAERLFDLRRNSALEHTQFKMKAILLP